MPVHDNACLGLAGGRSPIAGRLRGDELAHLTLESALTSASLFTPPPYARAGAPKHQVIREDAP